MPVTPFAVVHQRMRTLASDYQSIPRHTQDETPGEKGSTARYPLQKRPTRHLNAPKTPLEVPVRPVGTIENQRTAQSGGCVSNTLALAKTSALTSSHAFSHTSTYTSPHNPQTLSLSHLLPSPVRSTHPLSQAAAVAWKIELIRV